MPDFCGVLRQRIKGKLHPLTWRQGQQVVRRAVPQPADRLAADQQRVQRLAAPKVHGDLVQFLKELARVVQGAEQIDGLDAILHEILHI